jgi:hypothetical protein
MLLAVFCKEIQSSYLCNCCFWTRERIFIILMQLSLLYILMQILFCYCVISIVKRNFTSNSLWFKVTASLPPHKFIQLLCYCYFWSDVRNYKGRVVLIDTFLPSVVENMSVGSVVIAVGWQTILLWYSYLELGIVSCKRDVPEHENLVCCYLLNRK